MSSLQTSLRGTVVLDHPDFRLAGAARPPKTAAQQSEVVIPWRVYRDYFDAGFRFLAGFFLVESAFLGCVECFRAGAPGAGAVGGGTGAGTEIPPVGPGVTAEVLRGTASVAGARDRRRWKGVSPKACRRCRTRSSLPTSRSA